MCPRVLQVLPSVLLTWLAMVFVVAFSSSLDVAAIEMEVGHSLDYNHELQVRLLSFVLCSLFLFLFMRVSVI